MSDLFRDTWRDWLRGWKAYAVLAFIFTVIVVGLSIKSLGFRNGEHVEAEIVSLGSTAGSQKYTPGLVLVTVRTDDGGIGSRSLPWDRLSGCEVGDRIDAIQDGLALYPNPSPCD